MLGRNTITPPTPPITPSMSISFTGPSGMYVLMRSPINPTPASIQSIGYCPMVKVAQNISHIMNMKIGNPNSLLVTTASIIAVVLASSLSSVWSVSRSPPDTNPYFELAITVAISSSCDFSISATSESRSALISA